jgi:hypothetical protein
MAVATKRDFSISYGLQTDKTGTSTGNTLFVDQINDYVGVGQGSPAYKLDVDGDINFTGSLRNNGAAFVASNWTTSGNNIYRESKVGIGESSINSTLSISDIYGLDATSTTITSTAATAIDNFVGTTYRSAKIHIQITQGAHHQTSDILLIHDGTTASIIESGTIATNDYLANFSADVTMIGNVRLLVSMLSSASATVKVVSQKIRS